MNHQHCWWYLSKWSSRRGSNPRPPPWQSGALPVELLPRKQDAVCYKGMNPLIEFGRLYLRAHSRMNAAGIFQDAFGLVGIEPTYVRKPVPTPIQAVKPSGLLLASCCAPGRNRTFVRRLTAARSAIEPPEHIVQREETRCRFLHQRALGPLG